jgi:two-component system nitrate/nitrite response regulator NarL
MEKNITAIRVVLVDDHRMLLAGLQMLLEPRVDIAVVGTATTAAEAYAVVARLQPDVVLLDINLPDQSGVEVCRQLTATYPSLKVLVLTTLFEKSYVTRIVQEGAAGYLLKNAPPEELTEAIARVHAGRRYFSDEVQELLLQPTLAGAAPPLLTRREKEILVLIASGLTSQAMADQLFLSALTIETHRRNLLTKFGAGNTAALIRLAAQHQLI